MFGSQKYPEGQLKPGRCFGGWNVWCHTGAIEALRKREYVERLAKCPDQSYIINFANGSAARIKPGDELWQVLAEIAKAYTVQVFPLNWEGKYVPWSGNVDSLRAFDAISISVQE